MLQTRIDHPARHRQPQYFSGLVLEQVACGRKEPKRLAYLAIPAVDCTA